MLLLLAQPSNRSHFCRRLSFVPQHTQTRTNTHTTTIVNNMLLFIYALFVALASFVNAADQAPDVAFSLVMEYRPDQEFRSCKSTDQQVNCGFCYLQGGFLGWNCNCDEFVSKMSLCRAGSCGLPIRQCHNTLNECYYITQANPSTYTKIECKRDALNG